MHAYINAIAADIASPANIARVSQETAAGMLECSTARLECKLARHGIAKRGYNMGALLGSAVTLCIATIGYSLAAIGGVL